MSDNTKDDKEQECAEDVLASVFQEGEMLLQTQGCAVMFRGTEQFIGEAGPAPIIRIQQFAVIPLEHYQMVLSYAKQAGYRDGEHPKAPPDSVLIDDVSKEDLS